LLVNDPSLVSRAEIIREKGTNRSQFFRGQVDKYTWVDIGSSYLPNELTSAFLYAQLKKAHEITDARRLVWRSYYEFFSKNEYSAIVSFSGEGQNERHNAHIFYVEFRNRTLRTKFIKGMALRGIECSFHYVPLHQSNFGKTRCISSGSLEVTERIGEGLVRLPLWVGLDSKISIIISALEEVLSDF
jgi:dTDP-4-amino-4,6-dideoxygalactose transaminase